MKSYDLTDFSDAAYISNFRIGSDGSLIRREGSVVLQHFGERVRGVLNYRGISYVFAGTSLYSYERYGSAYLGTAYEAYFSDEDTVTMFAHGDYVYVIGGGVFYRYSIASGMFESNPAHAPLVMKAVDTVYHGNKYNYESPNTIGRRMTVTINPVDNQKKYALVCGCDYIERVRANGVTLPTSFYTFVSNEYDCYIEFINTEYLTYGEVLVEYVSSTYPGEAWRSERMHNLKSYIHEGKDFTRLFLYGGYLGSDVIYSEVSYLDASNPVGTIDYFPEHARFTVGDGSKPVTDITCLDGKTLISTRDTVYELKSSVRTVDPGIEVVKFTADPLIDDVGVSENSCSAVLDGVMYFISEHGLRTLSWDRDRDAYICARMDFAGYASPMAADIPYLKLFISPEKNELWCYKDTKAYIFDLTGGMRYLFNVRPTAFMVRHSGGIGFAGTDSYSIYDTYSVSDDGYGFSAEWKSMSVDFGNVFRLKDIHSLSVAFARSAGALLDITVTSDTGDTREFSFEVTEFEGTSPKVNRVHTRLGNTHHVTVRAVISNESCATRISGISFEFSEKGALL